MFPHLLVKKLGWLFVVVLEVLVCCVISMVANCTLPSASVVRIQPVVDVHLVPYHGIVSSHLSSTEPLLPSRVMLELLLVVSIPLAERNIFPILISSKLGGATTRGLAIVMPSNPIHTIDNQNSLA